MPLRLIYGGEQGTDHMRQLFLIAIAICSCAQIESSAGARRCPVADGNERVALVARARSCQKAVWLFNRCTIGATLDGRLALSVMTVCEKTSLHQMSAKEREAYDAAIYACNAPYVMKRGTIYRSVAAHCRVDVIAEYARQH
jgi:hypothetical protein